MKKNKLAMVGLCALVLSTGIGASMSISPETAAAAKVTSPALEVAVPTSYTEVNTLAEFTTALKDVKVTSIKVMSNISFKGNITDIPNRDLVIDGSADQGVVINSNKYSIYGKQNTKGINVFAIQNATITGDASVGRFFTGGAGNGPVSYGWDVNAKNITYTGARFVHLSEGTLVFDGTNKVDTRAENAWVGNLVFKTGSVYKGTAASQGQYSAFYFNGCLDNGKAAGKVQIEDRADVDIKISPENDKNYFYPAFYDKVYQVNVGEHAKFNVDAAGVAFQFIPRADYPEEPSLNVASGSTVNLNGRGGGAYAAMKLQQYGTNINLDVDSELIVTGNSKHGVIESAYNFSNFNLNSVYNFEVTNRLADAPLFNASKTEIKGVNLGSVYTWNKTGETYGVANKTFNGLRTFNTSITKNSNGEVQSTSEDAVENFQIGNYGKIKFDSEIN